jgi:hypothetical protein
MGPFADSLALLKLNRGRQSALWKSCPPRHAGLIEPMARIAEECSKQLHAPNKSILQKEVAVNTLRLVKTCSTLFVKDLHQSKKGIGITVFKVIRRCRDDEYRV